jgi:hypothetical protein
MEIASKQLKSMNAIGGKQEEYNGTRAARMAAPA